MPDAFRNAEAGLQVEMMRLSTSKVQQGRRGRHALRGLAGVQRGVQRGVRGGVLALLVLAAAGLPTGVVAQKYRGNTSAAEIAKLPKYCYAQYLSEQLAKDPQHSIQGCGAFMNHFCPGLVDMMRAQKPTSQRWERAERIESARKNFAYTLEHMPPNCWLRADAEKAAQEANTLAATIR